MITSSAERKMRRLMPLIRFMQAYLPLRWSGWLTQWSLSRARMPAGIARQPVAADGVSCEWLIPKGSPGDQALLYCTVAVSSTGRPCRTWRWAHTWRGRSECAF